MNTPIPTRGRNVTLSVSLPMDLVLWLEGFCDRRAKKRSDAIREAVEMLKDKYVRSGGEG